ncbi:DNA mismatch repair protein, putative [Ixodes scapularis]|uniref:DNA mismatch repair protein, putative n=1 Tax=Ixodes scapularis TaxID=6945 RepID=B7P0P2_IXOSC|nr:DNA mismatch repair protein, putative [Ixodes scapularis]|eukprot:XP_002399323.1 DNA mismatch repair protein, putative [Ixodes scapularis]
MSNEIKAIDRASVHRICSGQVVLNLAMAVKELVENSIDAGARSISVRLKEYGSKLVEVVDDGDGVEEANFEGLTLKYHTSKLRDFSDLQDVATFGFRGEALSSVCALCNLSISTCHKDAAQGTLLKFDHHGAITSRKPCAREASTTVSLENLFVTLPVRHKEFLSNLKREFNKMAALLTGYCLVATGVNITCTNHLDGGRKQMVLSSQGSTSVRERISAVFGAKETSRLLEIEHCPPSDEVLEEFSLTDAVLDDSARLRIEGFVSTCAHGGGRSSSDRQFIFINSRPCELPKVKRLLVNAVYHTFNRDQYPFLFINIHLQRRDVDVNVTPDKRSVFLHHEKHLLALVKVGTSSVESEEASSFDVTSTSAFEPNSNEEDALDVDRSQMSSQATTSQATSQVTSQTSLQLTQLQSLSSNLSDLSECTLTPDSKTPSEEERGEDMEPTCHSLGGTRGTERSVTLRHGGPSSVCVGTTVPRVPKSSSERLISKKGSDGKLGTAVGLRLLQAFRFGSSSTYLEQTEAIRQSDVQRTPTKDSQDPEVDDTFSRDSESDSVMPEPELLHSKGDLLKSERLPVEEFEVDKRSEAPRRVRTLEFCLSRLRQKTKESQNDGCSEHSKPASRRFRAAISPSDNAAAENELAKEISKDMFGQMEIIGQFNLGFIVAKLGDDLFIVDQHAADEKYNFERLERDTVMKGQKLLAPQPLELTAVNESVLIENREVFEKNGFAFEVDESQPSGRKVKLVSVPASGSWQFGKEGKCRLFRRLVYCQHTVCRPSKVRQMFASRACRKSVMVGMPLTISESFFQVVSHLGELHHPWNCPHGRPTMRHLVNLAILPD